MIDLSCYQGREQTGIKHFILSEYLTRFGPIIGSWCSAITYVDCFSGPWHDQSPDLSDTSFSIALDVLRSARTVQQGFGRSPKLRAFFVERDRDAHARLRAFVDRVPAEDVEIQTRNLPLEECIGDIVQFVRAGGPKNFPFTFIDPTGWSGFGLQAIEPLLTLNPGEVLINFMTGHIRRLVEHPEDAQQASFQALYGPARAARVRDLVEGTVGAEREDILVSEYMAAVAETGHFQHVCAAVVLNPAMDRTHFHLIYATRNPKGLEVFKGAERRAMEAMQQARSNVQDRALEQATKQATFEFQAEIRRHDNHYEELRERYTGIARARVAEMLAAGTPVRYDDTYFSALAVPLTFESDLKRWIAAWVKDGSLRIDGLKPKARVPQVGFNHALVRLGPLSTQTGAAH